LSLIAGTRAGFIYTPPFTSLSEAEKFKRQKSGCSPWDAPYRAMVQVVAKFITRHGFKGRVVLVTSPSGAWGCNPGQTPGRSKDQSGKWSWSMPAVHEPIWRREFALLAPQTPFYYLNITPASNLRRDLHPEGDCLHYCSPGVPDLWADMLFSFAEQLCNPVAKPSVSWPDQLGLAAAERCGIPWNSKLRHNGTLWGDLADFPNAHFK
jgi:hypothetical protein